MARFYGVWRGLLEHAAGSYTSRLMAQPNPPTVTVVIPVHNEASFLPGALPRLFDELADVNAEITVLVAENGSTDGTTDLVREAMDNHGNLDLLELPTPDYGAAMRDGFLQAESEWVVNFDIDYFSGEFLANALDLADSADIVLASKRTEGADDKRTAARRFATWTFNQVLRFALSSGVSDTHGMKLVRATVVDDIAPQVISTTDLFDTELVVRAERAGYRIAELPASVEELRESKSNLIKRVPRTLKGVWAIRRSL
jgi:glycosyltransferase involved in cell wall biosynthesis